MGMPILDNFNYQGSKPLDGRTTYATIADMKNKPESVLYNGCTAYVEATEKYYTFNSNNTVDPNLGKWREFETGGGHTIQDDGTNMADRDNLNFVGMDVEDNSNDGSTDVSEHRLTSAEISEMMGGIPNPQPRYPVIFDERGTEFKVGWYILANGTKKPVYEKTVDYGSTILIPNSGFTSLGIDASSMELILGAVGYHSTDSRFATLLAIKDNNLVKAIVGRDGSPFELRYFKIRYTKTTDIPV